MQETSGDTPTLAFGSVPHTDDEETRLLLTDFCSALSATAGQRIVPKRFPAPDDLAAAFAAGRIQLGWLSPTLFLTDRRFERAVPLVSSLREGRTAYHAVLFVAERSEIRSLSDLPGRHAAWVAETSAAGYIFPRLALADLGLDPRTLFADETFHGTHGQVAREVLHGRADVGGTFAVFEDGNPTRPLVRAGFSDSVQDTPGRIIHATGPIPSDLMVASQRIPIADRARLTAAFEHAHEDEAARRAMKTLFGADGYVGFEPSQLQPLREKVETGRALGLL